VTPDGYHLTIFHVWHHTSKGQPVFFQHGILSSADTWMMNKEKSPAFVAAKAGYDVWLGNNRGNKYSRGHDKWDPATDQKEFFDYSFYELGMYDAPTQIDFVLN
jgi:lysosomal acid lipase/cholesteryl ester hydrolase